MPPPQEQYSKKKHGVDNPALQVSIRDLDSLPQWGKNGKTSYFQDLDHLETKSNPETMKSSENTNGGTMNKKRVTMEAEDVQTEEKVLLKRRFSFGDVPKSILKPQNVLSADESFLLGRADSNARLANQESTSECRHRIRMTEVAPSHSSIMNAACDWQIPIEDFSSKRHSKEERSKMPKRIRSYYKAQDELIGAFEDITLGVEDDMQNTEEAIKLMKSSARFAKITFCANLVLLCAKLASAILSGSISIISSLVDSVVDLASGVIIWVTGRAVQKRNPYVYPQGRTKLEPIAIVILSVVMSLASVQLIRESAEKIVHLHSGSGSPPTVEIPTIVITASAIVIKFVLWLVCRRVQTSTVQALAQDHRNDVMSNSVALVCGYVGSQELLDKTGITGLVYVDPIGAMLISIYIIFNWWRTGYGQIKLLTGHTAKPDFLKKLTWICVNHHPKIDYVDTVRAFHFGNNFLVEVDIVLPETMSLKEAHDIGEQLQQKLERLQEVERAFVHLDYEFEHNPSDEHKTV